MINFSGKNVAGLTMAALAAMLPSGVLADGDKIRVGLVSLVSHSPSIIAEGRGYFAEQDLDVEMVMFQSAQPMAVAIAAGDVDFGITAITGGLISLSEKGAVKVIGGALEEAEGIDGNKYLASTAAYEAGLTSIEQLAGKRFGVTTPGSSFHYMAHKAADCAGIDRKQVQAVPLNAVPAVGAALRTGQVDAWSIQANIADPMVAAGEAMEIGTVAECIPGYQVTTVFTSTKRIEENPDTVKRFLAGFSKGIADYNAALVERSTDEADRAEIVGMVHKYVYTDTPADEVAPKIEVGAMRISPDAALNVESVEDQLKWFQSEGMVPSNVTLDMLVDTQFLDAR